MKTYRVDFYDPTTHWVRVKVHPSRKAMHAAILASGLSVDTDAYAACIQLPSPQNDGCIAELHFFQSGLYIESIAHECCHAAYHRTRVRGFKEGAQFDETLASDTGELTSSVFSAVNGKS